MKDVLNRAMAVVIGFCALTTGAWAQTRSQVYSGILTQETQTVFVRSDVGIETLDSQSAASKDTTSAVQSSIGGWAGEERLVGINFTNADLVVPFALNGSRSHTAFRDVRMMARFGWLIPSVGVSMAEVDVSNAGAPIVGLFGTGFNTGIAFEAPLAPFLVVHGESVVTEYASVYDKLGQGSKLSRRIDADINASFDVTQRMVDFLVGYRARQYGLEVADKKYRERAQGAYVGLRLGIYF